MVVLTHTATHSLDKRIILIFGVGLVGSAIVKSLTLFEKFDVRKQKSDWRVLDNFQFQLNDLFNTLDVRNLKRIDWVWSAGKAGFAANENEVDTEFLFYRAFLEQINEIEEQFGIKGKSFIHLVSSAGGLFEGQHVISKDAKPQPKRPYGRLKFKQENLMLNMFHNRCRIYRPSSIFGFYAKGQRVGLITNLIINTLRSKVTSIYGKIDTQRDYVWGGDVADFIAKKVWFDFHSKEDVSSQTHFLVSAKPTSIFEIIYTIQKITNLKVLQKFDKDFSNSDQIIFSRGIIPDGWSSSSLNTCIRKIYQKAFN
jgi:nucleoside-diphosphate-sugar epimerase